MPPVVSSMCGIGFCKGVRLRKSKSEKESKKSEARQSKKAAACRDYRMQTSFAGWDSEAPSTKDMPAAGQKKALFKNMQNGLASKALF